MATEKNKAAVEQAVDILVSRIERGQSDDVTETLLNAIFYLRAGCYPFNRTHAEVL